MTFAAALLGVLAGAMAVSVAGWAASRFFTGGLGMPEKLAWSFAVGLLVQAILFAIVVSILPGRPLVSLLVLDAVILAASVLAKRPRRPAIRFTKPRASVTVLFAAAGAAWLFFFVAALSEPMWSTDYLAMWGLKAKTITTTGRVPARLFSDAALYWAHKEYPLLVPFSLAALAPFAGGWDDQALALLFPLCEIATLAALFGFLARRVSPLAGATAAALTALCFPLYRAVNAGTAEVPFALSLVLVSSAFLDSLSDRSRAVLARMAAASLFCVSIKQEGWIFVGLLATALLLRRRRLGALALSVPAVVHWALLYFLRGAQTRRDFDFTFFRTGKWGELVTRFIHVLGRMLGTEAVAAWLPLVAIILYLVVTRRGAADALLPIFPLQILCYAIAFSVSSFDPMYAVDGAFSRIATTLFPALALVLAARLAPHDTGPLRESLRA